jgi:hypothetical protein
MKDADNSIEKDFFAGKRTNRVPFAINDSVEVTKGPNSGRVGAVISIQTLSPEVTVIVELGDDGTDIEVPITFLRLLETSG